MPKNLYLKKSLGQHFLKDKEVVTKIIEALDLDSNDQVLEIGPGTGILTEKILPEVKELVTIEKDNQFVELLFERFGERDNFEVIHADFLKLDLNHLELDPNFKLVGNLPYNQSKPILRKILESDLKPSLIVVMLQKEVAEKILDQEKGSILGLMTQFFAEPGLVASVSREAFSPKPKVDSKVIRLVPRKESLVGPKDQVKFFGLIKKGFLHPRKKLLNNLPELSKLDLEKINLKETVRPEELKLEQWLELFKSIKSN